MGKEINECEDVRQENEGRYTVKQAKAREKGVRSGEVGDSGKIYQVSTRNCAAASVPASSRTPPKPDMNITAQYCPPFLFGKHHGVRSVHGGFGRPFEFVLAVFGLVCRFSWPIAASGPPAKPSIEITILVTSIKSRPLQRWQCEKFNTIRCSFSSHLSSGCFSSQLCFVPRGSRTSCVPVSFCCLLAVLRRTKSPVRRGVFRCNSRLHSKVPPLTVALC